MNLCTLPFISLANNMAQRFYRFPLSQLLPFRIRFLSFQFKPHYGHIPSSSSFQRAGSAVVQEPCFGGTQLQSTSKGFLLQPACPIPTGAWHRLSPLTAVTKVQDDISEGGSTRHAEPHPFNQGTSSQALNRGQQVWVHH